MRSNSIDSLLHRCAGIGSILYLAIPVALFFLGWLQPAYAVIALIILFTGIFFYIKRAPLVSNSFSFVKNRTVLISTLVFIVGWVLLSGIGITSESHQTSDFNKHNAILADLTTHSWPVIYETASGEKNALIYYIAYYLPSAAVGKIFHSIPAAEIALLPWTIIGLALVFYWIFRLLKRVKIGVVLLFIIFAGIDIIGQLILRTTETSVYVLNIFSFIEGYASIIGANYQGNTSLLFWAPQHAIAAWLVAGILLTAIIEKSYRTPILFVVSLALLWSPMVVVGLAPVMAAYLFLMLKNRQLSPLLHPSNTLIPLVLLIIFGLYFASGTSDQVIHTISHHSGASGAMKLFAYSIFILLEFLLYVIIVQPYIKKLSTEWRIIIRASVIFLCLVPLVIYGTLNDIGLRAPIVSLFVIFLLIAHYLYQQPKTTSVMHRSYLLIALISLGSVSALVEFNTHITGPTGNTHYWGSINSPNLNEHDAYFAKQYLGNPDSAFFRTIGQKP